MGTRGAWGFIVNETTKLTYNHFDSYPDGLGEAILSFLNEYDLGGQSGLDKLREQADALVMVNEDSTPTDEDIERLREFHDPKVSTGEEREWYSLLRHTQGNPEATLKAGFMIDSSDFPKDSLFCEWAYVIDLDQGVFEIYKGFQDERHNKGRFVDDNMEPISGYYPVALFDSFPLDRLPDSLSGIDSEDDEDGEGEIVEEITTCPTCGQSVSKIHLS